MHSFAGNWKPDQALYPRACLSRTGFGRNVLELNDLDHLEFKPVSKYYCETILTISKNVDLDLLECSRLHIFRDERHESRSS